MSTDSSLKVRRTYLSAFILAIHIFSPLFFSSASSSLAELATSVRA